jgi:AraC-like DNA-binding protein/quercetin dioxygenase-like cupin family protein
MLEGMASESMRTRVPFARSVLHGSPGRLPEVDSVGYGMWTRRRPQGLGTHAHPQWEIHLMVRGSIDYWVEGEELTLRAGDLSLVRPGERHSGAERVRNRTGIAWLALAEPMSRLPGLERADAAALDAGFATIRTRRFPASATTFAVFSDLVACIGADGPVRDLLLRSAMHRLLGAVLTDHAAHARSASERAAPSPAVARATAILRERLGSPIGVDALARAAGVSRTVLHERFVAELGATPMAYWTELRIARAKQLLAEGATGAAAASALGFATAQHFARVFKDITGDTPRGWARRAGGAGS